MKNAKIISICSLLILSSLLLSNCAKKADETRPISDIKTEADKMSVDKLNSMAMKYKDAIAAKKGDLKKIAAKLKDIPLTKMIGTEAKELKGEMEALNKSISALKSRFQIYYDKLKEKGGELSGHLQPYDTPLAASIVRMTFQSCL